MKTQHTPGPWLHDDGHIFIDQKGREYNSIATVYDIYTNDGRAESNTKLIAAAPELLEALKAYVKEVESRGNESDWAFNIQYTNAMKAIKKAEQ